MTQLSLKKIYSGKVRDLYEIDDKRMLMVASDRLSAFDVILDDGKNKRTVTLNRPYQGLYIVPGIWRELVNFSSGSNCLVLASHKYDEADYIREYVDYCNFKNTKFSIKI